MEENKQFFNLFLRIFMEKLEQLEKVVQDVISKMGQLKQRINELEEENQALRDQQQNGTSRIDNLLGELDQLNIYKEENESFSSFESSESLHHNETKPSSFASSLDLKEELEEDVI